MIMMSIKIKVSYLTGECQSLQHPIEFVYRNEKQHREGQAGCIVEYNVGLRLQETEHVVKQVKYTNYIVE